MGKRMDARIRKAIEDRNTEKLEAILDQIETGIDYSFLAAAEKTDDESVVMLVWDHYVQFGPGSNDDSDYENLLFMAISRGFVIAANLAVSTWKSNPSLFLEKDGDGRTVAEIAREKGMSKLAKEIERHIRKFYRVNVSGALVFADNFFDKYRHDFSAEDEREVAQTLKKFANEVKKLRRKISRLKSKKKK